MDEIQNKLNVISWLTDYKANILNDSQRLLVELNHSSQLKKWFITAKNPNAMLKKLDVFINNRVAI